MVSPLISMKLVLAQKFWDAADVRDCTSAAMEKSIYENGSELIAFISPEYD